MSASVGRAISGSLLFIERLGKKKLHVEQFGVSQIRVLTITDSAKRVDNMLNAVDEITGGKGSNFFLFAAPNDLMMVSPLSAQWRTGKGDLIRITD